jgi:hypothetical protein
MSALWVTHIVLLVMYFTQSKITEVIGRRDERATDQMPSGLRAGARICIA